MRSTGTRTRRVPLMLAFTALLAGAACSDDPIEPDEHPEAGGVVIRSAVSGTVLATSVGANVAFDQELQLGVGEALEVEILFLDVSDPANLALAFQPHADEGESLRVTITNEGVVEYHVHGDHGDFEAVSAGETTAQFELMHGSHADFRSGPLTIVVQ